MSDPRLCCRCGQCQTDLAGAVITMTVDGGHQKTGWLCPGCAELIASWAYRAAGAFVAPLCSSAG